MYENGKFGCIFYSSNNPPATTIFDNRIIRKLNIEGSLQLSFRSSAYKHSIELVLSGVKNIMTKRRTIMPIEQSFLTNIWVLRGFYAPDDRQTLVLSPVGDARFLELACQSEQYDTQVNDYKSRHGEGPE